MQQHLESKEKTAETPAGRGVWFYWVANSQLQKLERTWLNMHVAQHGALPLLNKVSSPVGLG